MRIEIQIAAMLVRVWTRLYTCGMNPLHRDTRRAEIESDLWEGCHDRSGVSSIGLALEMIARSVSASPTI